MKTFWLLGCALVLVGVSYAYQGPFREYPSVEYGYAPLPPDYQEKTEWAFARLMYPPGWNDGYRGRFDGDWRSERGSTLSGGQRQRIAIARALVTDPRILIFDEATSALDYESERIIQQNMRRIAKGRTVLIIAHRLSTVRATDRIVTLERGRLVEDGTHETLIGTGGRYASLYRLQAGLHEVG